MAPDAAQKETEIQNLRAMLEKAVQQIEPDGDFETFKVASQDDDDDEGMQDLDSLLAEVQDSDEETMAEKQAPNKETANAQVTYPQLLRLEMNMLNQISKVILKYRRNILWHYKRYYSRRYRRRG